MFDMIRTTYYGPTNSKGSRISASMLGYRSVVVAYDHALSNEGNHRAAMQALCTKLGVPAQLLSKADSKRCLWVDEATK